MGCSAAVVQLSFGFDAAVTLKALSTWLMLASVGKYWYSLAALPYTASGCWVSQCERRVLIRATLLDHSR